jgi:hypothetical protein
MEPLKMVLLEVGRSFLYKRMAEAAKLYKEGKVSKIFLYYPNFHNNPSQLFAAHRACTAQGVPFDDVIMDEPNLALFVKEREEGVDLLVVITSWLQYVATWYRYRKQPKWVWIPIRFHVPGII